MTDSNTIPSLKLDDTSIVKTVTDFVRAQLNGRSGKEVVHLLAAINVGTSSIGREFFSSLDEAGKATMLNAALVAHAEAFQKLGIPFPFAIRDIDVPKLAGVNPESSEEDGEGEESPPAKPTRGRPKKQQASRMKTGTNAPRAARDKKGSEPRGPAPKKNEKAKAKAKAAPAKTGKTDDQKLTVLNTVKDLAENNKKTGIGITEIAETLDDSLSKQQVAKRLAELIEDGKLRSEGQTRARRYFIA